MIKIQVILNVNANSMNQTKSLHAMSSATSLI